MANEPHTVTFGNDDVSVHDILAIIHGARVAIDPLVYADLSEVRDIIDAIVESDLPAYGVTRGLGPHRDQPIPVELQHDFQAFIFASHDAAVGDSLSPTEARSIMVARLATFVRSNSGATAELFDGLLALIQCGITPAIPSEGSVGAADLAALAAIGRVLTGEGVVLDDAGGRRLAAPVLAEHGLKPVQLGAKDAHALVDANSASTGLSVLAIEQLDRLLTLADIVAVNTIEALRLNVNVFSELALDARPHPGQRLSGRRIRALLDGSKLGSGEVPVASLQDPLSFRTIAQVHGTMLEQIAHLEDVVEVELNSKPENPVINRVDRTMVPTGNFSTMRLTIALEQIRLMVAHVSMLAERRISHMIAALRSGRSLVEQVTTFRDASPRLIPSIFTNTSSSLTNRIQHLALPVSLFGSVFGDGVEDHNAHAYSAVRVLMQQLDIARQLLAIEAIVATGIAHIHGNGNGDHRGPIIGEFFTLLTEVLTEHEDMHSSQLLVERVQRSISEFLTHSFDAFGPETNLCPSTLRKREPNDRI